MQKVFPLLLFSLILMTAGKSQNPFHHFTEAMEVRYGNSQPVIHYTVRIDSLHTDQFEVEMRVRNTGNSFNIAMFAHPEYDDRYSRYVEDIRIINNPHAIVQHSDSNLWHITGSTNETIIHYRIHLPAPTQDQRAAWRPFLTATGGLTGGPHTFMYIPGHTLAPAHVTLEIPNGWDIATGLQQTNDPHTFFAATASTLMDCPILMGRLQNTYFMVDGVPHRVAYWPAPRAASFNLAALSDQIRQLVQQATLLFGRLPYRDYTFLLQDNSYGSLEHANSVTLGANAGELSKEFIWTLQELSHEYFHSWNLVRIRPVEYGDITYKTPPYSRSLWWSEGLTILYADLLLRRAHLPVEDSTRLQHLQRLIQRYYNSPGNVKKSPEQVSLAEYAPPGALGDYFASSHTQGELIGTLFDIMIRHASNGTKSIDDAMREMMAFSGTEKGFTGKDIEKIIGHQCGQSLRSFFDNHIRGNKPLDYNKYLRLLGLQATVEWKEATDDKGVPAIDHRIYASQRDGKKHVSIIISDPESCWGKAGLHTNDEIISINGTAINYARDFYQVAGKLQKGDKLVMEGQRSTGRFTATVIVSGFQRAIVTIIPLPNVSQQQQQLLAKWITP